MYRYSQEKLLAYLSKKVTRLSESGDVNKSRTLERQLAKDGLLEDGKEEGDEHIKFHHASFMDFLKDPDHSKELCIYSKCPSELLRRVVDIFDHLKIGEFFLLLVHSRTNLTPETLRFKARVLFAAHVDQGRSFPTFRLQAVF